MSASWATQPTAAGCLPSNTPTTARPLAQARPPHPICRRHLPRGGAVGPLEFDGGVEGQRWLRFLHTVEEGSDGAWDLRLSGLTDLAGNAADPVGVGRLLVDTTSPGLSGLAADRPAYSTVPGFDLVRLTFDTGESLDGEGASPEVTLGGRDVACGDYQGPSGSYECTVQVTAELGHGPSLARVQAEDAAGNVDLANTAVEIDLRPPAMEATLTSSPVGLGQAVELVVTFDEELGGPAGVRRIQVADSGRRTTLAAGRQSWKSTLAAAPVRREAVVPATARGEEET